MDIDGLANEAWKSRGLLWWGTLVGAGFLGSCLGSFMNVVIYRLPRGESLVHPGSRCPACGASIAWYHNLPIAGWLVLRGRCANCRGTISPRYPLVEAFVAVMFAYFAVVGPLSFDEFMPEPMTGRTGWLISLRWAIWAYQLALLGSLFCLSIIEWESESESTTSYPWRLFAVALVAGLFLPVGLLVALRFLDVPWEGEVRRGVSAESFIVSHLGYSLGGGGLAYFLSLLARPATSLGPLREKGTTYATCNLLLVGFYLGLLPIGFVIAAVAMIYFLIIILRRVASGSVRIPWSFVLFAVTLAWLGLGMPWSRGESFFKPVANLTVQLGLVAVVGLLSLATWAIGRERVH